MTSLLNTHPHSMLPSYLSEAFSDLYAQDGLVVLGRGLGWLSLLCSFVRFYGDTSDDGYAATIDENKIDDSNRICHRKPPLVFVLNLRDEERSVLLSTLSSWGTPPEELPRIISNEAGQSTERAALYARGGVFIVTSRILIVDLLQGTAKARDIEGLLVAHAERVVGEKSVEAFILRIFRSQKYFISVSSTSKEADPACNKCGSRGGFIKAFSDDASSLVSGSFAKVEKVLKSLQVPRLFLYPRFHASVAEELERNPPTVIELNQPLSETMKSIQTYLAASIRSCLRDLRQKSTLVDLSFLFDSGNRKRKRNSDSTDMFGLANRTKRTKEEGMNDWKFTIQQCIATNFSFILSRQLEGDWHRLSWDVKQCISDLRTLSQLFHHLIEYDCVQFWTLLMGIKAMSASSKTQSYWMLQDAGENLFRVAKERVFRVIQTQSAEGDSPGWRLKPVLEHKPKERLLLEVLTEIERRWNEKLRTSQSGNGGSSSSIAPNANVLLMVKDERALRSVRTYLTHGGKENRAAAQNFLNYLDQVQQKIKSIIRTGGHDLDLIPMEQRLLYEEHSRVHNTLFGSEMMDQYSKIVEEDRTKLTQWKKKRKIMIEEKARGSVTADAIRQQAYLDEAVEQSRGNSGIEAVLQMKDGERESSDEGSTGWSSDEDELAYKVEPTDGLKLFIRTFSKVTEGEASLILQDIRPTYVVMYDSDSSFIRTLEIFSATMTNSGEMHPTTIPKEDRLQVYFLLYEASAEDIVFSSSLDREKEAFDALIEHHKRMPTSLSSFNNFSTTQEMQQSSGFGGSYSGGMLPLSMDTRTGGGKTKSSKERRDIAVDVREFRAALPSILHQGGCRLAPATLTVGDFILSNIHCVERKSISDLYGSFNSGRLRDQVQAMVKYYKCPCLLIEFDPEKNFALQNSNELGGDIRLDSITSKLAILTMEFPALRILWSRSPHETLKIFKKLKRNHEDVDVEKAIAIGNNESLDEFLLGGEDGYYDEGDNIHGANDAAKQMLLKLPGVNAQNARKIMNECDSIANLALLSRDELKRIAGPIAGQKLYSFFRERLPN